MGTMRTMMFPYLGLADFFHWQRFMFWAQAPAALILGPLLFLVIPVQSSHGPLKARDLLYRLARADYAGALTLVSLIASILMGLLTR